jgi:hypothetical protein
MHEPVEGNTAVHFGTAAAGQPGRLTGTLCQRRSHTVPHPKRDIPIKTLKSIERQSGLKLR